MKITPTLIKQSLQKLYQHLSGRLHHGVNFDANQFMQWQNSQVQYRVCAVPTAWLPKEAQLESVRVALNTVAGLHQIKLQKNKKLFILVQRINALAKAQLYAKTKRADAARRAYTNFMRSVSSEEVLEQQKMNNQIAQSKRENKQDYTLCIHTDDEPDNSHLLGMSKINLADAHCHQINNRLDEIETQSKEGNTQIDDLKTLLDAELAQLLAPTPAPEEQMAQATLEPPDKPLIAFANVAACAVLCSALDRLISHLSEQPIPTPSQSVAASHHDALINLKNRIEKLREIEPSKNLWQKAATNLVELTRPSATPQNQ